MPKVTDEYISDKKNEILEAAYRVCCRKPIMNVEIKDIIEECGFSHGAIYRYYKDLDEILKDLVISINRSHSIQKETDEIFEKNLQVKELIKQLCKLLSNQMETFSVDVLKIAVYCHVLAINQPQRAEKITSTIKNEDQSPLSYVVIKLCGFLHSAKDKGFLNTTKTIDEIMDFFICSYEGIMMGATFCDREKFESYPKKMFDLLADSLIGIICK